MGEAQPVEHVARCGYHPRSMDQHRKDATDGTIQDEPAIVESADTPDPDAQQAPETNAEPTPTDDRAATTATTESPMGDDAAEVTTESVTEAILFATDAPLPPAKIARILGVGDARSVKKHIDTLNDGYERTGAAFRIEEVGGGLQMLTLPLYNNWVSKLLTIRRETKLSSAALETLAVVAYRQPVLRADIESIRGVAVGDVLLRLREMGLVKIVGRAEVIGRPMLYGTTKKFLETFGLATLEDLPKVDALALPTRKTSTAEPEPDSAEPAEPES